MLAVLVAVAVSGPKPVAQPPMDAVKPAPQVVVRAADKLENSRPLDRLLQGWPVADTVPLVLKPDFRGGSPCAAIALKF
ncbi:MAG TPA: hypothetical protein VEQ15_07340 [Myxococcales bacterium]|nr:hypothetical protein [Myxococcales bacterium]